MRLLKRVARASVWHKDALPENERRYWGLYKWCFPLVDILFFYFGAVGWHNGVASVQEAASADWQTTWSAGIAICAFFAFVGVAFPRLWPVELVAKLVLISLISMYVALYLQRGADDSSVTAFAGLIVSLVVFPTWRLGDLAIDAVHWLKARRRAKS